MSIIFLEDWNYIDGKLDEKYYVWDNAWNFISDDILNPFGQAYTQRAAFSGGSQRYLRANWAKSTHHSLWDVWFYPTDPCTGTYHILAMGNSGSSNFPVYPEVKVQIEGNILRIRQRTGITNHADYISGEIRHNRWHYLELEYYHNNSGFMQAWLNGQFLQRGEGDMYYDGNPQNCLCYFGQDGYESYVSVYFGPVFVIDMDTAPNNTSPIGISRAHRLIATAAGNYTQWDVSGETDNYAALNDQTVEDDYVYTSVSGEIDTYVMEDIDTEVTVVAVKPDVRAKDDGTSKNIGTVFRSNDGTDFISGEQDLSASQSWYQNYYQTNPSGEISWTPADLNSGEWGIQLTY